MDTRLISRRQLENIARRSLRYPLHVAEKDYFLVLALKAIYDSPLGDRLVFKGGTALHHHYLPQYRFSEDLDFTSTDQSVTEEDVREVFEKNPYFAIKKDYSSDLTVKVEKLQYVGILDQPNYLKIDISNVDNLALPASQMLYQNTWGIDVQPRVMNLVEICAEKLSATSGRIRYRDFYDLYLIVAELKVEVAKAIELFDEKDVQKPIGVQYILDNWEEAKKYKQNDLNSIFIKKQVSDEKIERFLKGLDFTEIKEKQKIDY